MSGWKEGDLVGIIGERGVYRIKCKVHGVATVNHIISNIHWISDPKILTLPRIGPFQFRQDISPGAEEHIIEITNVSGASAFIYDRFLPDAGIITCVYNDKAVEVVRDSLTTDDDKELWDAYVAETMGFPSDSDPYLDNPCLFDGHSWVDTGMKVSYCRKCECKGEFNPIENRYEYVAD